MFTELYPADKSQRNLNVVLSLRRYFQVSILACQPILFYRAWLNVMLQDYGINRFPMHCKSTPSNYAVMYIDESNNK